MPQYRIKYFLWRIEAATSGEAKKKVCEMLRHKPEDFLTVENAELFDERRPLWRRLLGG